MLEGSLNERKNDESCAFIFHFFCMNRYSQRDQSVNKEDQEKELPACWGLYSAADDHKFIKIIQVWGEIYQNGAD